MNRLKTIHTCALFSETAVAMSANPTSSADKVTHRRRFSHEKKKEIFLDFFKNPLIFLFYIILPCMSTFFCLRLNTLVAELKSTRGNKKIDFDRKPVHSVHPPPTSV